MKLIRLHKRQRASSRVCNPIFDNLLIKTDAENFLLLQKYLTTRSAVVREEIVLSNLHLVRHTVGRYLFHWAETKRWEDDMVSVGLLTLMQSIEKMEIKQSSYFRPWTVCRLKHDIETYLNKSRCSVSASLSTNYRRLRDGKPIASKIDLPLTTIGESQ